MHEGKQNEKQKRNQNFFILNFFFHGFHCHYILLFLLLVILTVSMKSNHTSSRTPHLSPSNLENHRITKLATKFDHH